ncbi:hypothetical protein ACFLQW_02585 [Candidatus Zixiibacteriota bacterium]
MMIFHQLPSIGFLHERWYFALTHLLPRINLLLQREQRDAAPPGRLPQLPEPVDNESALQLGHLRRTLIKHQRAIYREVRLLTTNSPGDPQKVRSHGRSPSAGTPAGGDTSLGTTEQQTTAKVSPPPRTTVLQRSPVIESIQMRYRANMTHESTHALVRRATHLSERVDKAIVKPASLVMRHVSPVTVPPEINATASQERTTRLPAKSGIPTSPEVGNIGQVPAAYLNQLTDHVLRQLDRRVSAWRERTGKT